MATRTRLLALRLSAGLVPLGVPSVEAAPARPPRERATRPADGPSGPGAASRPDNASLPDDASRLDDASRPEPWVPGPPPLSRRTERPWVRRWRPERNVFEVGVLGGVLLPARDLELFEPRLDRPDQGLRPLAAVAPELGVRLGYYPLRALGVEAEAAYLPSTTLDDRQPVTLWGARGHVIAQLPSSSIAPFVVLGGGALGVVSDPAVVGRDTDATVHIGIGTKVFIDRRVVARLDLRDEISPRAGVERGATSSIEILLGLSISLGRERDLEPARCPPPLPAPAPAERDVDGDGVLDPDDRCPAQPGPAPDGCPLADRDEDGLLDPDDRCPDEPGVAPDGCPAPDGDGDGIPRPADRCPDAPENHNGFEDDDGCPDALPVELERFGGRLDGIRFELGQATLTRSSRPRLDEAVEVLARYPGVRIEISGHTDNRGRRELNMKLSRARARAVEAYLVERGIDPSRISTRGAGPDEPIDSNATRSGRSNNRRIEFRVLD